MMRFSALDTSSLAVTQFPDLGLLGSSAQQLALVGTIVASLLWCMISGLRVSFPQPKTTQGLPTLNLSVRKQARRWKRDAIALVEEAYQKFPGKVFQVHAPDGPQVFIPHNMIEEIKAFPDSTISILDGVRELFQPQHTLFPDPDNRAWVDWTKQALGKNIARYCDITKGELQRALPVQFSSCKDWQPIQVHPRLLRLVATITNRIFVGPVLCRDKQWLQTSIDYTRDVFIAIILLKLYPRWLRGLAKYTIPHMWYTWRHTKIATRVVKEALQHPEDGDAIHGVYNALSEDGKMDYLTQGRSQLGLAMAGVHTTVRLVCQVLFDLAARPEYIPILHEEILSVLGTGTDKYTVENFTLLKKLDSVMKESMRLHGSVSKSSPLLPYQSFQYATSTSRNLQKAASFRRKVLKPTTLSDGTFLPAGIFINIPTNSLSHDPSIFPHPEKFDGLRFYNMRQRSSADANKHQLTTVDNTATYFGAGRHACPGRAFASMEAKMILVELVKRYEFRMIEGDGTESYMQYSGLLAVNPNKKIQMRDRV
jgi:ent-kaurene oxidase